MCTKYFSVPADICNMLEALNYEVESRKSLISFMIDHGMPLDTPIAKIYVDEYTELFSEYEIAKKQFERLFIKPAIGDNKLLSWTITFENSQCEIKLDTAKEVD